LAGADDLDEYGEAFVITAVITDAEKRHESALFV
jgi:hypothetical protein